MRITERDLTVNINDIFKGGPGKHLGSRINNATFENVKLEEDIENEFLKKNSFSSLLSVIPNLRKNFHAEFITLKKREVKKRIFHNLEKIVDKLNDEDVIRVYKKLKRENLKVDKAERIETKEKNVKEVIEENNKKKEIEEEEQNEKIENLLGYLHLGRTRKNRYVRNNRNRRKRCTLTSTLPQNINLETLLWHNVSMKKYKGEQFALVNRRINNIWNFYVKRNNLIKKKKKNSKWNYIILKKMLKRNAMVAENGKKQMKRKHFLQKRKPNYCSVVENELTNLIKKNHYIYQCAPRRATNTSCFEHIKNYLRVEIKINAQNFIKINQVGQGAYGDVWMSEDVSNEQRMALKKLKLRDFREGLGKTYIREISLLNKLKHPNIIELLGVVCAIEPDVMKKRKELKNYIKNMQIMRRKQKMFMRMLGNVGRREKFKKRDVWNKTRSSYTSKEENKEISIESFRERSIESCRDRSIESYSESIESYRDRSIESCRDRSIESYRERSTESYRERSTESYRERSTESCRERSIESYSESIESYRDRSIESYRERSQESYRERSRESYRERSRESYQEGSRESCREKRKDSSRDKSSGESRERNGDRYQEGNRDKTRERTEKKRMEESDDRAGKKKRETCKDRSCDRNLEDVEEKYKERDEEENEDRNRYRTRRYRSQEKKKEKCMTGSDDKPQGRTGEGYKRKSEYRTVEKIHEKTRKKHKEGNEDIHGERNRKRRRKRSEYRNRERTRERTLERHEKESDEECTEVNKEYDVSNGSYISNRSYDCSYIPSTDKSVSSGKTYIPFVGMQKENKLGFTMWMVFEYIPFDLSGYLEALRQERSNMEKYKCGNLFSVSEIKDVMLQLLTAVSFCHEQNVLHRDIKTANLLIDDCGTLKLADFGLARFFSGNDSSSLINKVITLWYRPPELLLGESAYDEAVDVWSCGCVLGELLTSMPLFSGEDEIEVLKMIASKTRLPKRKQLMTLEKWNLWNDIKRNPLHPSNSITLSNEEKQRDFENKLLKLPGVTKYGVDLLKKMLNWNPNERISAKKALQHPWFYSEPLPQSIIKKENINAAHSFMTKNYKKIDTIPVSTNLRRQEEKFRCANVGNFRKMIFQNSVEFNKILLMQKEFTLRRQQPGWQT